MALSKAVTFKAVPVTYWKIISVVEDVLADKSSIRMGGYASREARAADRQNYLTVKVVSLQGVDMTRPQMYAAIKQLPEFSGASDA